MKTIECMDCHSIFDSDFLEWNNIYACCCCPNCGGVHFIIITTEKYKRPPRTCTNCAHEQYEMNEYCHGCIFLGIDNYKQKEDIYD